MNIKNSKVVLTINLEGCHKPRFVEIEKNGVRKLKRVCDPENPTVDCIQRINLNEEFVNHAISFEGKNSAKMTFAYSNWKKMTPIQRLEANLGELCLALRGKSFTYEILPE